LSLRERICSSVGGVARVVTQTKIYTYRFFIAGMDIVEYLNVCDGPSPYVLCERDLDFIKKDRACIFIYREWGRGAVNV
jgi:hypothetical protein